jgi:hypothetical protein
VLAAEEPLAACYLGVAPFGSSGDRSVVAIKRTVREMEEGLNAQLQLALSFSFLLFLSCCKGDLCFFLL